MLNKERIEKKNAEKAEREAELAAEAEAIPEIPEETSPPVVKKDRSGIKCRECGKLIAEVEHSGNGNGGLCGDCWRKHLAA